MERKLARLLRNLRYRYRNRKAGRYVGKRRILNYAPYPLDLYSGLLGLVKESKGMSLVPFCSRYEEGSNIIRIYVRHDIDTRECMDRLSMWLDIDRSFGAQSGFYFRTDGVEYRLKEHRQTVETVRHMGFEVGLHTLCYLEDNYLRRFKDETERFSAELGFAPRSFTVHGLGIKGREVRHRFTEGITEQFGDFGYDFSDCHPRLRGYGYVIEDCHWEEETRRRFIYDDFVRPPSFLPGGANCLILTHPCYWRG